MIRDFVLIKFEPYSRKWCALGPLLLVEVDVNKCDLRRTNYIRLDYDPNDDAANWGKGL